MGNGVSGEDGLKARSKNNKSPSKSKSKAGDQSSNRKPSNKESSATHFDDEIEIPQPSSGSPSNPNRRKSLASADVQQRVEATTENKLIVHAGIKIQYAWVSQRGFYPDEMDKDNQDSYTILPAVTKRKSTSDNSSSDSSYHTDLAYFGVYDGHGKTGHLCSWFVRDNLPKQIFSRLSKAKKNSAAIQSCIWEGHVVANKMLHDDPRIDDSLSGTASVSVILCNRTLYVSNVGDSRAIILSIPDPNIVISIKATMTGKELPYIATPLSLDQTPYRIDERERIKKYGARIMSMDQIEGIEPIHENWGTLVLGQDIDEGGDPPRIWHPQGDYPGTAFTRSIGDHVAEELGVVPDPEILEYELTDLDKFIVIASDGVWEFLTNQMVADIVALHKYDPLAACKQIVTTAYNLWLQYEVRTDDITIIILALDAFDSKREDISVVHGKAFSSVGATSNDNKSVPSLLLHSQSYNAAFNENEGKKAMAAETTSPPITSMRHPMSSRTVISNALLNATTQRMAITDEGTVIINSAASSAKNSQNANLNTELNNEASVVEAKPVRRSASREKRKNFIQYQECVQTDEDAATANEELNMEELMVMKNEKDQNTILSYFQKNFLFQHLNSTQMNLVVSVMKPVEVKVNDWIIKQGDPGDKFYIIDSGRYEVRVQGVTTNPIDSKKGGDSVYMYESNNELHPGFGELSLMYGKPRAASVIAVTEGKLWSLDRRIFRRVVLRSADVRKGIIRALRNVELFKSLSFQQIQRLADVLNEEKFKSGEYIIKQGEMGDSFYLILNGVCDCTKILEAGEAETFLVQRKEYEYFGEKALLTFEPRAANVIAKTEVKVLTIGKAAFDEVLGSLADIIDEDRLRREALAAAVLEAPQKLAGIDLLAVISTDNIGPLMLGSFRSNKPNLSVRTFLLSEIESLGLTDGAVHFIEIARLVTLSQKNNPLVPRLHSASRDTNAIHLLYREPVAADLSTILSLNNRSNSLLCSTEIQVYIVSCIVSALDTLHGMGIIYRSIQPESLYVDIYGRILIMDYRVSKISIVGGKTFTICGAADYLAPEQISQVGHTASVDLWCLGVLMYEMAVGSHPFSQPQGEIATYTKITTFGTTEFPELIFPDSVPAPTIQLIKQLVQPVADNRLGAGVGGFTRLKRSSFFDKVVWTNVGQLPPTAATATTAASVGPAGILSPLKSIADMAVEDMIKVGMDNTVIAAFSKEYQGSGWDKNIELL